MSDDLIRFLASEHDAVQATEAKSAPGQHDEALAMFEAGLLSPEERASLVELAAEDPALRKRISAILREQTEAGQEEAKSGFSTQQTRRRPIAFRLRPYLALAACIALLIGGWFTYRAMRPSAGPWIQRLAEARTKLDAGQFDDAAVLAQQALDAGQPVDAWRDILGRARLGTALAMADTRIIGLTDLGAELTAKGVRAELGGVMLPEAKYRTVLDGLGISPDRPGASPALLTTATRAALAARMFADATRFARAWTLAEPQSARAHNALGLALWGTGEYADAAGAFEQALKLDSSAGVAHLNAAAAWAEAGRREKAVEHLQAFLKLAADAPEAATARKWLDRLSGGG